MRIAIFWALALLLAYGLFEWLNSIPYEKLWGSEWSPKRQWQLLVFKRPQQLKQAPDIALYKQDARGYKQLITVLHTDEDDRADLKYEVHWENDETALFSVSCTNCNSVGTLYWQLKTSSNAASTSIASVPTDSIKNPLNRWHGVVELND